MMTTRVTLLEQLRDGTNTLAWDEFFGCYWPTIYSFARYRGCSEDTAEEIVQDVMLAIFEHRQVYQYDPSRGRFRDWLGVVVRNKVVQHRRRPANRLRGVGGEAAEGVLEQAVDLQEPDTAWEAAFEGSLLRVLLDVVRRESDARVYLAFELLVLQGLSGNEVARLTGLSRNAVYKARTRIIQRLIDLGASYREEGHLTERIKEVLREHPPAAVQRSLTERVYESFHSRSAEEIRT